MLVRLRKCILGNLILRIQFQLLYQCSSIYCIVQSIMESAFRLHLSQDGNKRYLRSLLCMPLNLQNMSVHTEIHLLHRHRDGRQREEEHSRHLCEREGIYPSEERLQGGHLRGVRGTDAEGGGKAGRRTDESVSARREDALSRAVCASFFLVVSLPALLTALFLSEMSLIRE